MEFINSLLCWRTLAAAAILYYGTLAFYRLFLHPLARFPGPKLAAISRWYEAYYDVVKGGQYTKKIAELHKTYGKTLHSQFQLLFVLRLNPCSGRSHYPYQPLRTACDRPGVLRGDLSYGWPLG